MLSEYPIWAVEGPNGEWFSRGHNCQHQHRTYKVVRIEESDMAGHMGRIPTVVIHLSNGDQLTYTQDRVGVVRRDT